MKKRHIQQAKKLCEEHQHEMNKKTSRHVWTAWPDVHIAWKRFFYREVMKREQDVNAYSVARDPRRI